MDNYYQDGRRIEVSETRDRLNEIEAERAEMRPNTETDNYKADAETFVTEEV